MANRNTLSENHIEDFKVWLIADGYTLHEPKGFYEVIRATKPNRKYPFIAFRKIQAGGGDWNKHLSVADRDMGVVRAFLRDQRQQKHSQQQEVDHQKEENSGEIELKPCPFCGGRARMEFDYDGMTYGDRKWDFAYYAHCTKCYASTTIRNRPEAAWELWNTRVDGDSQTTGERKEHGR